MNSQQVHADAVLLVGHGTRSPIGGSQFLRLAELVRSAIAPVPLSVSFIELQRPSIEEALLELGRQGKNRVVLSPALLFAAGHAKQDIPQAVAIATAAMPALQVDQAKPL